METFSALLAICGDFTGHRWIPHTQRPVTRSFNAFFDLRLNKRLSKQWWGWWFETLSCPLWRHCNDILGCFQTQYNVNGGKCGLCGDPYQGPLEHEAGGKYAKGIIVDTFMQGGTIEVDVDITANHKVKVLWWILKIPMVSCQKGPTRHAYAWQIGPFWEDTLEKTIMVARHVTLEWRHTDVMVSQITGNSGVGRIASQLVNSSQQRKAPHYRPLRWEFSGELWISLTKGQLCGKRFHAMTSSWYQFHWVWNAVLQFRRSSLIYFFHMKRDGVFWSFFLIYFFVGGGFFFSFFLFFVLSIFWI